MAYISAPRVAAGLVHVRLCAAAAVVLLTGCLETPSQVKQPLPDQPRDVANVYVTAYPAIAWSDISEQLEPKHNLTIEQARDLAVRTTQFEMNQFLSTFAAGLGIGLPVRSATSSTSFGSDGVLTTTGSRQTGPGTVPTSSGASTPAIQDSALAPDLSKGPGAVNVDGNILLTAATALYQQAKILDNQISKATPIDGYRAHLVTFQINVQPKRRNLPFDTYVNISLHPANWDESVSVTKASTATTSRAGGGGDSWTTEKLPPVIVHPLIITDAFEASNTGRSAEIVRQAALSLSGLVQQVGVRADIGKAVDDLKSTVNQDKNSLITLGRINDSTLRVRLGALYGGVNDYAMVPRTFNVSVVVLSRNSDDNRYVKALSVVSRSEFVHSLTGESLDGSEGPATGATDPVTVREALAKSVLRLIGNYDSVLKSGCAVPEDGRSRVSPQSIAKVLGFLRAIDNGDYAHVDGCLQQKSAQSTGSTTTPTNTLKDYEATRRRLLAKLLELQTSSSYATFHVPLKVRENPALPPEQTVIAQDDTRSLTMTVRDGSALPGRLHASLMVTWPTAANADKKAGAKAKPATDKPTETFTLRPIGVTVSAASHVSLVFPSLTDLGLKLASGKPLTILFPSGPDAQESTQSRSYALLTPKVVEPSQEFDLGLNVASKVIVSDGLGTGQVGVAVKLLPSKTAAPPAIFLKVTGGDVRANAALGAKSPSHLGVAATVGSFVVLQLGNLAPGVPVVIQATDGKKAISESVQLHVERTQKLD